MKRNCKGCGKCCMDWEISVYSEDTVPDRMVTASLEEGIGDIRMKMKRRNGHRVCIALDENNLCTIYKNRPAVCREFEKNNIQCNFCFERAEKSHLKNKKKGK